MGNIKVGWRERRFCFIEFLFIIIVLKFRLNIYYNIYFLFCLGDSLGNISEGEVSFFFLVIVILNI